MNNWLKLLKTSLFFFIVIVIGLSMNGTTDQELSDTSKMLYGFVAKTGKKLGGKYDMSVCGVGGGAKEDGIWQMNLSLDRYGQPLTEEEARKLIVGFAHDFLAAANNDEQLRPFLKDYPVTTKNLRLSIYSKDHNHCPITHPFLTTVNLSNEEVGYFTIETSDSYQYKSKKYEPFEQAVAIVNKDAHPNISKTFDE